MRSIRTTAIRPDFIPNQAAILSTILGATDYGVLLTDLNHQSIACNQRFGELFGIEIDHVVENSAVQVREMVLERIKDLDSWMSNLDFVYGDPEHTQTDELELVSPWQVLRRSTTPVKDEKGVVIGRVWGFLDITQSVRQQRIRELLFEISQLVDPDPGHVYREIVELIGGFYDSLCILSLQENDFLHFRAVGGPPSPAREHPGNKLTDSFCQLCLRVGEPLIVQDSLLNDETKDLLPSKLGFTRYLGVPVRLPTGVTIGTLCLMDGKSCELFTDDDVDFLSMSATRIAAELSRESFIDDRIARDRQIRSDQEEALRITDHALRTIQASVSSVGDGLPLDVICSRLTQTMNGFGGISLEQIVVTSKPPGSVKYPLNLPDGYFGYLRLGRFGNELSAQSVYIPALQNHVGLVLSRAILGDELAASIKALESAEQRVVQNEKLAISGTLATSIAHDIRNILATLTFELGSSPNDVSWERIRTQIERFNVLNHRLLVYAQPKSQVQHALNLVDILRNCLALLHPMANAYKVNLRLATEAELVQVLGDAPLLEHLFVNLILNAMEAMSGEWGEILLSCEVVGEKILVHVVDDGPGVPASVSESLFKPFVTSRRNGFGLGLYSCRRIANDHGGQLELAKSSGEGTTFRVEFPKL